MERIKEAIRLAKAQQGRPDTANPATQANPASLTDELPEHPSPAPEAQQALEEARPVERQAASVRLSSQHLERDRIIAHLPESSISAPFEVLRTRLVQEMDQNGWNVLMITSPTPRCGKSVTAINLAISVAKLTDRDVVLLDLDLRKPSIMKYLGVEPRESLSAFLEGKASLDGIILPVATDKASFGVIGSKTPVRSPSELISSPAMQELISYLKALSERVIVVVDMPPILTADDVMAFLPLADCCMMTAVENMTTSREIEACDDVLQSTHYMGCVLNMSSQMYESYY